jgi:alpha-galactosidase/6-phospho-beta-glucosidase family protein
VNAKGIQPLRVEPLPHKVLLQCIYPSWLSMERTLEALRSGDKSMLLYGILDNHQTRSYDHATETLEALLNMEPNEPMAYIEDVNEHYAWPGNW